MVWGVMSQSSFPRTEHLTALKAHVEQLLSAAAGEFEVRESGLDRFRCQYRIEISQTVTGRAEEVPVHFQLVERLLAAGSNEALDRLLTTAIRRLLVPAGSSIATMD
jgi:glycine betaine/choline ABC-type transport system substrate-binding protein